MAGGEACKLFVKHLPSLLTDDDRKDLLRHFGAREVICMGRKGKMCNAAFAEFCDEAAADKALSRLHQLEVLGSRLVVEIAKKQHERLAAEECSRTSPQEEVELEEKDQKEGRVPLSNTPNEDRSHIQPSVGVAPKLGIHYRSNPAFHYLYPPPNAAVLTNIAHTLACVPKFYVQVLHLMNKLNLPDPFGPVTAVPPTIRDIITVDDARMLSSEESEIESDEEEKERRTKEKALVAQKGPATKSVKHDIVSRKRPVPRTKHQPSKPKKHRTATLSKQPLENAFEQPAGQHTRKIAFKLTDAITAIFESGPPPVQVTESEVPSAETEGFGKFEPPPEPVVMETSEEPVEEEESNEFVSLAELMSNRMSDKEIRNMSSFKKYAAGEPTSRLYIKNLAKSVEEMDLQYIFGRYTRNSSQEEKDRFDIRLMKEGRMKGQAFVTLPDEELAQRALKEVHGYVLQGKPMVIQFARSAKAKD